MLSSALTIFGLLPALVSAAPALTLAKKNNDKSFDYSKAYDVQGHRGGRGQAVENSIAAFAWGLLSGVTTLELDVSRSSYI
jgi:glycerophosphoryl diester phosphodiesterase